MPSANVTTTATLLALSPALQITAFTRFILLLRIFIAETSTVINEALQLPFDESRELLNTQLEDTTAKLDLVAVFLDVGKEEYNMDKEQREELEAFLAEMRVLQMELMDLVEEFQMMMLRWGGIE